MWFPYCLFARKLLLVRTPIPGVNPVHRGLCSFSLLAATAVSLPFMFGGNPSCSTESVRFNRDVLPILSAHCFACHGPDEKNRKAGLRLDSGNSAYEEQQSGFVPIVRRDRTQSELHRRLLPEAGAERMPPPGHGEPLTPAEIEMIGAWIDQGAEWEDHWAYLSPVQEPLPSVSRPEWGRNEIDAFILARIDREGLTPSPEADPVTLVRRVYFDLIGLPPTPEQVEAFLADQAPDAYERLVESHFASPHFGEKWARWWLDLSGYADSDGYLSDFLRPWAWRYRDWVVDAFNQNKPFDQFTIEQVAGDLLPNASTAEIMGTGFLRNTLSNREGGALLEEFRVRQVIDRTKLIGSTWLGLTVGCAECHDHKHDVLTQKDFFALYACFNNADEKNISAPLAGEWLKYAVAKPEYDRKRKEMLDPIRAEIESLQRDWERELLFTEANPGRGYEWERALELLGLIWGQSQGEGQLEGLNIAKTPWDQRASEDADRLQDYFLENGATINPEKFKQLGLSEIAKQLKELRNALPPLARAPGMTQSAAHRPTAIHVRGDFRNPGEAVGPAAPHHLPPFSDGPVPERLKLARWLVDPSNPLTARVVVNRIWQELYGQGIVPSSNDFGVMGDRPSHPELLDWLSLQFINEGRDFKATVKRMVCSTTYRQSSAVRSDLADMDPTNRWLARHSRVRLSAEAVRDAALAVSGLLNAEVGGPSVHPPQPESVTEEGFDNKWEASEGDARRRRGLYIFLQRTSPFAQLVNFDLPDVNSACTRRVRSNTPLQALNLLNDPNFHEAARGLGDRMQAFAVRRARETGAVNIEECIDYGFRLCLARLPSPAERDRLAAYLARQVDILRAESGAGSQVVGRPMDAEDAVESAAWAMLGSVLLNLDEFITKG